MNNANGYAERVQRVVDYLAERLDEALDLEALARVACFSASAVGTEGSDAQNTYFAASCRILGAMSV
jgi:hypothetical protein